MLKLIAILVIIAISLKIISVVLRFVNQLIPVQENYMGSIDNTNYWNSGGFSNYNYNNVNQFSYMNTNSHLEDMYDQHYNQNYQQEEKHIYNNNMSNEANNFDGYDYETHNSMNYNKRQPNFKKFNSYNTSHYKYKY